MNRGEIYRSAERVPEREGKPGYYVVVSRHFIARNEDIATVVCAPIYTKVLGIRSEVRLGPDIGIRHESAIRCDFLMLMFKRKLTQYVATGAPSKKRELGAALTYARDL